MRVKITGDSVLDLSKEMMDQYDITISPFAITLDGKEYRDTIDITPELIYEKVQGGAEIPVTSAINVAEYYTFFKQFVDDYDYVIHFNISSASSSTHQNAVLASQEFENVVAIDSQNISIGIGFMAIHIKEFSKTTNSIEEIIEEIERFIPRIRTRFVIDTLEFVQKGGRISSLTKIGADVLRLHPSVEIIDGELKVEKLHRGSTDKTYKKFAKKVLAEVQGYDPRAVSLIHSGWVDQESLDMLTEMIKETNHFERIVPARAGCAISTHAGPRTIGIIGITK